MPIPNATTTASVNEVINSEYIERMVLDVHRNPTIAEMVGWMRDASGNNSATHNFPKLNEVDLPYTEGAPHPETVEVPASEQTYTETTATAATVAIRRALSDEAVQDSLQDQVATAIRQNLARLRDQADVDLLANILGGTQTGGDFTGLPLTVDRFGAALAAARELNFTTGMLSAVLSHIQIRDLAADLRNKAGAIYGGALGDQTTGVIFDAQRRGQLGLYEGVMMYQTSNVPEADPANDAGAIFASGEGGALGMAVWKGFMTEADREIRRLAIDIVTSGRYGTVLTDDENLVKVISLNS